MSHLNAQTLTAILEGGGYLPPEDLREIRQHLESGCDACEALLAREGPDLDTLLRIVSAQEALARLDATGGAPSDEALPPEGKELMWDGIAEELPGFATWSEGQGLTGKGFTTPGILSGAEPGPVRGEFHVLRPTLAPEDEARPREAPRHVPGSSPLLRLKRVALPFAALAAAFAMYLYVRPPTPRDADPLTSPPSADGVKGVEQAPPAIRLQVARATAESTTGAFDVLGLVREGSVLAPSDTLFFELKADQEAYRYLFALDGRGGLHLLLPSRGRAPIRENAGARRVSVDRSYVALELSDLEGPIMLVAAASESPMDVEKELLPFFRETTTGSDPAKAPARRVSFDILKLDIARP
jgi:hypothetical protein